MLAGMKTEGNIAAIRYNLGNRIRMLRRIKSYPNTGSPR